MLIKLNSVSVLERWPAISKALLPALPESHKSEDALRNLSLAISNGRYTVWSIADSKRKPMGLYVTTMLYDDIANERILLGYALVNVGDGKMQQGDIDEAFEQLKVYARSRKIDKVVAYTTNPRALDLCDRIGCRRDWTYVEYKIEKEA